MRYLSYNEGTMEQRTYSKFKSSRGVRKGDPLSLISFSCEWRDCFKPLRRLLFKIGGSQFGLAEEDRCFLICYLQMM